MDSPKISVVIPSYNKVRHIAETLDSIISQKYPNLEVIIQDGMSTDGTLEIIKKYATKYPKTIKWESKKDKGQLDAINAGLRKTSGEIFGVINADDVYVEGVFSKIGDAYVKNHDELWFAGRGIVINEKGGEVAKLVTIYKNFLLSINRYPLILITNYLMEPSIFITRVAYRKYGSFIGTHDFVTEYDLWLRLGKVRMPLVLNEVLSKFRIEPGTKTKMSFKNLLKEDRKIVSKYTKSPFILLLHDLHNFGRTIVEKFV